MEYPPSIEKLLTKAGASVADTVAVSTRDGRFEGVVMPHHAFSGADILTLKLANGYNVGIAVADVAKVELVAKHTAIPRKPVAIPTAREKPTIAVLGTGGTIAAYVDYRTGAVHPAVTAEELVFSVPELLDLANVRARVVYSVLSENLTPANWQHLAEETAKELNGGAHAVVIPHGTDTLGFTTAALSFMLRDLTGPVIVVGAQRSSDRPSSDAAMNLVASARLSSANLGEVVAVMHGETGDTVAVVHRGTKVRKMHSSRRDAFRSINAEPLGRVHSDGRIDLSPEARPRAKGPVLVDPRIDPNVVLIQFYPGMEPDRLEAALDGVHGAVMAGTGLGHISTALFPLVESTIKAGAPIVMTSQTLYGRVGMRVYAPGRDLIRMGVISGEDMLPETAYVKLMWVLGHTRDPKDVARQMATDIAGEINPRIRLEHFEE